MRERGTERDVRRERRTVKDERGFPDAARAVEEERLLDAVVLRVVVEDGFQQRSRDDFPRRQCRFLLPH